MADKDPQLEFKKRARRRLVGAIALALLAAIVLPIVMDQEPQPVNQDIQIRIPSRDTPFEGRAAVAPPAEPVAGKAPAAAADDVAPPEPPAAPADPRPAGPAEAPAAKAPEKPSAARPAEKKEAQPPPVAPESARAQAILEAKDEYVVQLGVFSDPANVRKVQARVKAEGYNSFTEAIGGGKTRVRAGPFAGREAAEKARDKLKRGGLDGMVAPRS
jgi:DedD protein